MNRQTAEVLTYEQRRKLARDIRDIARAYDAIDREMRDIFDGELGHFAKSCVGEFWAEQNNGRRYRGLAGAVENLPVSHAEGRAP